MGIHIDRAGNAWDDEFVHPDLIAWLYANNKIPTVVDPDLEIVEFEAPVEDDEAGE